MYNFCFLFLCRDVLQNKIWTDIQERKPTIWNLPIYSRPWHYVYCIKFRIQTKLFILYLFHEFQTSNKNFSGICELIFITNIAYCTSQLAKSKKEKIFFYSGTGLKLYHGKLTKGNRIPGATKCRIFYTLPT